MVKMSDEEFNAMVDEEPEITVEHNFWVQRRQRGVYLAHWMEDYDGNEEWDAFATRVEAQRWCAEKVGAKRLRWQEDDVRRGLWMAEYTEKR